MFINFASLQNLIFNRLIWYTFAYSQIVVQCVFGSVKYRYGFWYRNLVVFYVCSYLIYAQLVEQTRMSYNELKFSYAYAVRFN